METKINLRELAQRDAEKKHQAREAQRISDEEIKRLKLAERIKNILGIKIDQEAVVFDDDSDAYIEIDGVEVFAPSSSLALWARASGTAQYIHRPADLQSLWES